MEDDYASKLYKEYSDQRQKLDDASLEAAGRYDKTVLAITTGALALSVTFIEKIASNPQPFTLYILVIGWFLLLASVVFQLHALSSSHNSVRRQIVILDQQYSDVFIAEDPAKLIQDRWADPPPVNPHIRRTHLYNVLSKHTLIIGIICILLFSAMNVFLKKPTTVAATPLKLIPQKMEITILKKYTPRKKATHNSAPPAHNLPIEEGELIMTCKPTPQEPLKIIDESYTPPVNKLPPPPPTQKKEK
ncbi:MAG: hypothetical protein CXR31_05865 [Geobacter sp.]|nr:MAG: hypothetical protein CXR31_05865 [Geobacter sp.]